MVCRSYDHGVRVRLAVVNLTAGGFSGGYRSYLRHLLPRLAGRPEVSALRVLVPPAGKGEVGIAPQLVDAWPEAERRSPTRWIRRRLEDFKPDVVFVPTARAFRFADVPTVVMVRNMEPLLCPLRGNPWSEKLRNLARREVARRACRTADRIIAVSDFVRRFLLERWGVAAERMAVVRHGVLQDVPEDALRPPAGVAGLKEGEWLFTAGSLRPARGLEDALGALERLNGTTGPLTLAIAGEPDPTTRRFAARLKARAEAAGLGPRLRWLGRISAPEMGWCFRHAGAFVMTSRMEACPNTVLEAMAYGALSISTDQEPMPEFFADTATYYPAGDAGGLAQRIEATWRLSPPARERHRGAARERARPFTWDRTADQTVAELRRVLR
jgi:glycosyltransferase involved in cell wall biosynthesis